MRRKLTTATAALVLGLACALAQTPTFTIVQAVPAAQPVSSAPAAPVPAATASVSALKLLQELKAANDAIIAKQGAILLRLDEMEKAAEQIKIYSKRT